MRKQSISAKLSVMGLLVVGLVLVFGAPLSTPLHATGPQLVGMVADNQTASVTVFDPTSDTVLGSMSIGSGFVIGDCSITADGTLGFVTDFEHRVWVIDLKSPLPSLAAGTNPIPISNPGEDTSISPDQNFLVVVDGSGSQPISVIDIAARAEISTFSVSQQDHNSVEVLSDGSVLVTSVGSGNVYMLTIDDAGNLTDTGEVLFSGDLGNNGPNNVFAAPGVMSGLVVRRVPAEIRSFIIPGLSLVDVRSLTGGFHGISGLVNPAGDRVYVRSSGNDGVVDVFTYNSATGALGNTPLFSIPIPGAHNLFGMDPMAITPDGKKLYVSQPNALSVYDAETGGLLTSITDSQIVDPTGVCFNEPAEEPTAITLASFAVEANDGQAIITWETATEIDNAGFNIYRGLSVDGPWVQVNGPLIAAEGDPVSGAHYTVVDTPGRGTFYYHLEDIDFFGLSTLHEPALVEMGPVIRIPWYRPSWPGF